MHAIDKGHRDDEDSALDPQTHLLPFRFELVLQHLSPLFGLPDLIGILVFVHRQEFLIGLKRGLDLMQLIVAERTDEPRSGAGLLDFGDDVEASER